MDRKRAFQANFDVNMRKNLALSELLSNDKQDPNPK